MSERPNVSHGDQDIALANEILRTVCGSGVHGMAIPGTDDHDEMGVYIETLPQTLGLAPSVGHYVSRTKPEGVRSGPGDTDLVLYSLRHWMRLATAGNPTVLTVLYAPATDMLVTTPIGEALRALAPAIVSLRAGAKFLGYLNGQRERLTGGGRQSRVPNRPELVERYGYDTKYASHAIRLGYQGLELVSTGRLTLPLSGEARGQAMAVKTGAVGYGEALAIIDDLRSRLTHRLAMPGRSPLRPGPDLDVVNAWMIDTQLAYWTGRGTR